ncbi:hypothetical protein INS49_014731 [Diaporthe citri]|uniref:uncharacterized protein n=1 Tax=Diaporthe citri TaxID=83186 RepID=UPI001C7F01DF|nr:uncharacterized protein INS49_014731 [Diaporthe citri]KAG6356857.1 hypothetical protein INS49_014731 [Diaporthe citri]
MAPITLPHNNTIPFATSNGTIILVQGSDSPWDLDLNTLVTIVFGVISIAFQIGHMYHGTTRKSRTTGTAHEDVEKNGPRHPRDGQGTFFGPRHPPHYWDESQDYKTGRPLMSQPSSAAHIRGVALRKPSYHDNSTQLGTRSVPEGHVYRRHPWQNNEWTSGTSPWPIPTEPALQRQHAQRRQPGFF